ncbi:hypothetical protein BJ322DRAFT_1022923 [Thelephora terrestris]|uniref:Uncharacterized protein n=1 Tax=Thelephora terrestris TaxID=56493 RepID=A0A9P6H8T3_9AGAM|nr:hypothetical protein BJ322DRAFT_1022923 [Thelephora terrestris]
MSSPVGPSQATQSSSYPGTLDEEFEGYFSNIYAATEAFILGQGYESVSQDRLRRIMNKDWIKLFKWRGISQTKTLSTKAKERITKDLAAGRYADRENANESALMAPSSDPRDYSHVGVCYPSIGLMKGCVAWDERIQQDDFVFFCPFCAKSAKVTCPLALAEPDRVPRKDLTLFRCDPPALVISIVWHTTKHPFINTFQSHLQGRYSGNEKSVMFMDRSLWHRSDEKDEHLTGSQATADAIEFLEASPYAKILVIIDTHAAENGYFVWAKDANGDYQACSLLEILQDCSPKEIFKYMSDAEDAPSHHHKLLIMNLACGASVSLPQPRSELLTGPHALATALMQCCHLQQTRQSPTSSDYEVLMAKSVPASWAHRNHPVLSRRGHDPSRYTCFTSTEKLRVDVASGKDDHILYTWFDLGQPGGRIVRMPAFKTSTETTLGRVSLVAVAYPQHLYPMPHWDPPNANNNQAGPSMPMPAPPPLQSQPLPEKGQPTPLESQHLLLLSQCCAHCVWIQCTEPTIPMRPKLPTIRIPPRPLGQGSTTIRIPSQPLGKGSLTAVESRRAGTQSATATPPEPRSTTATPPEPRKRPQSKSPEPVPSMSDLVDRVWKKRARRDDEHSPPPPTL